MSVTDPHIKKRELVAVRPQDCVSVLTTTSGSSTSVAASGIVGEETTTSTKGVNWLAYQKQKKFYAKRGLPMPRAEFFSRLDLGNAFESVKKYCETDTNHVHVVNANSNGSIRYSYDGAWQAKDHLVGPTSSSFPAVPADLGQKMIMKGTTAIARTIPTNPVASAAQFLGELREGLPTVPGKHLIGKKGSPSAYADEFLNYSFAAVPLINDLRKFGEAATSSSKVIEQLLRDSGRLVRRRYTFPVERTISDPVVVSTSAYGSPGLRTGIATAYEKGPGKLTRTREETYEYWFSGAYTYLYQTGDRAVDRMVQAEQKLNALFGIRVSPELAWELTPWSWALDWMGNIGDAAHNITAFSHDSLVLRWGYIMCHYTCRDTYLLDGVVLKGGPAGPFKQVFVTDVKKRLKATPYGFGLDPAGFTARQWAILGSLGISRGTKIL